SSSSDSDSSSSSSSSSSTSSSEEWFQDMPKMNEAPKNPMLPYFVGYMGSSIQASNQINAIQAVQKLCQQIAHEIQNPNQIPEKATLAKFSILARLIRTMDAKQLEQASQQLYTSASSKSASQSQSATEKVAAWKAFRDAVAQAGTGPALQLIKEWIQNHKIQGEEAAEIVATLPMAARVPTKQYMDAFFDLIKKSEVQKQQFLNVSAILSFSNLVRKAQVDNATAHNRYPTHVFGRLNPKKASAVARDYIPYLAQQLKDAAQNEDSHKIQVYIRALGNTAHPKILSVFEPYLEGKKAISDFQRLHMVTALNKLAKVSPKIARPVLFRLYQNAGEAHEIRCIAVYLLMKTNPPASMLQRMAEFTNQDPSNEVRAVVKSAIESAANKLNSNMQQELSQNANAAVDMLNATKWGQQYSQAQFWSEDVAGDMNLAYQAALLTIGSDDTLLPRNAFLNLNNNLGGYRYKYFS
ncbi:vitellogenin-like, partial [Frankliniella occidentalis]